MAQKVSGARARDLFDRSHRELEKVHEEQRSLGPDHPITKAFDEAVVREVRRFNLKAKILKGEKVDHVRAREVLGNGAYLKLMDPFQRQASDLAESLRQKAKKIELRLIKLAESAPVIVVPGGPWLDFAWHSEYTYSSQTNAAGYAKARATIDAAALTELYQVPAQVEKRNRVYFVLARVSGDLDLAILKFRPSFTQREFVRRCWAQAMNPRVYNPFLPHGYEAAQGIDYQGRDLRKVPT